MCKYYPYEGAIEEQEIGFGTAKKYGFTYRSSTSLKLLLLYTSLNT